jgi:hypothetical protein
LPQVHADRLIPAVECFDRWYAFFVPSFAGRAASAALGVAPQARVPRDVPKARLRRDAAQAAGRIRGLGTSQSLVPLV